MKRIPTKFKLFGTTYNVVWDNKRMNDRGEYGLFDYSTTTITLSTTEGTNELSEDRMLDTFYHEKVHAILDEMHESELSQNEKFVDILGKLLRQADETAEYENEDR